MWYQEHPFHLKVDQKTCTLCKIEKAITAFSRRPEQLDGHDTRCRDCKKMYQEKIKQEKKSMTW